MHHLFKVRFLYDLQPELLVTLVALRLEVSTNYISHHELEAHVLSCPIDPHLGDFQHMDLCQ